MLAATLAAALLAGGCVVGAESTSGAPSAASAGSASPTAAATASTEPSEPLSAGEPGTAAPVPAPKAAQRSPRLYPNPALTPGDVMAGVTLAQIQTRGYSDSVRDVSAAEKRSVYLSYGLSYPQKAGAYECDHLIPLSLGGSNSAKNLWPMPAPEFHWKDGFEDYLLAAVRGGRVPLAEAQREMRADWYTYWVRAGKPGYAAWQASKAFAVPPPAAGGTSPAGDAVGWSAAASGKRYHRLSCRYWAQIAPANRRTGTVAQAKAAGKTPCKVCDPPQ